MDRLLQFHALKKKHIRFPFVKIGTQYWTTKNFDLTTTPQGTVIPNVTDNTTWASSQTLYDNTYAATTGTVEQKTYAAVKAAAMWCNYNNDPAIGAVYGKLYNWFAVKLLQMDIDYYNAANPATPWGWRVPTQTDFQTLSTYLGGDAVSGGKLKMTGTIYWNSPNTGADNSSGFSSLASGLRNETGGFLEHKSMCPMNCIDSTGSTTCGYAFTKAINSILIIDNNIKSRGDSLRLIKS